MEVNSPETITPIEKRVAVKIILGIEIEIENFVANSQIAEILFLEM